MKTRRKIHRTPEGNAARVRGRMARLDPIVAQMYADYQTGLTIEQVGLKYGRTMAAVYSLFRKRGLARRRRHAPETWARIAATRRAKLDSRVSEMYADYVRPMALAAVGRKYGLDRRGVRELFERRGLFIRPCLIPMHRLENGQIAPRVPFTDAQLDAMIAEESTLRVPAALKLEWREWSLERRGWFIARLRAKLARPGDRPPGPFSANVEPFDYATPRAHAIVARENAGTDSRSARAKIDICSQGVIFRDRLWFWSHKVGYQRGPWTSESGRPSLHKILWEETHGRPMPKAHCIRFVDGNPNNLAPGNLRLATKNDVARENQAAALLRKSRELTAAILNRHQNPNRHDLSDSILTPSL